MLLGGRPSQAFSPDGRPLPLPTPPTELAHSGVGVDAAASGLINHKYSSSSNDRERCNGSSRSTTYGKGFRSELGASQVMNASTKVFEHDEQMTHSRDVDTSKSDAYPLLYTHAQHHLRQQPVPHRPHGSYQSQALPHTQSQDGEHERHAVRQSVGKTSASPSTESPIMALEERFPFLKDGRKRTRKLLTPEQTRFLESILEKTAYPSTVTRNTIASILNVSPRKVQVWFQNKRQGHRRHNYGATFKDIPIGMAVDFSRRHQKSVESASSRLNTAYVATSEGALRGSARDRRHSIQQSRDGIPFCGPYHRQPRFNPQHISHAGDKEVCGSWRIHPYQDPRSAECSPASQTVVLNRVDDVSAASSSSSYSTCSPSMSPSKNYEASGSLLKCRTVSAGPLPYRSSPVMPSRSVSVSSPVRKIPSFSSMNGSHHRQHSQQTTSDISTSSPRLLHAIALPPLQYCLNARAKCGDSRTICAGTQSNAQKDKVFAEHSPSEQIPDKNLLTSARHACWDKSESRRLMKPCPNDLKQQTPIGRMASEDGSVGVKGRDARSPSAKIIESEDEFTNEEDRLHRVCRIGSEDGDATLERHGPAISYGRDSSYGHKSLSASSMSRLDKGAITLFKPLFNHQSSNGSKSPMTQDRSFPTKSSIILPSVAELLALK